MDVSEVVSQVFYFWSPQAFRAADTWQRLMYKGFLVASLRAIKRRKQI